MTKNSNTFHRPQRKTKLPFVTRSRSQRREEHSLVLLFPPLLPGRRPLRGSARRDTENVAFSSRPFFRPSGERGNLHVAMVWNEKDEFSFSKASIASAVLHQSPDYQIISQFSCANIKGKFIKGGLCQTTLRPRVGKTKPLN